MTEGEAEEKNSQEDYEKLMSDSAEKRTKDSKRNKAIHLTKRQREI